MAAFQIPLLGSAAGLLGIFFGSLTAGICGAIVLHNIEGTLEGKLLSENISKQLVLQGNALALQDTQFMHEFGEVSNASAHAAETIHDDMTKAVEEMQKMRGSLDEERKTENDDKLDGISSLVDGIE